MKRLLVVLFGVLVFQGSVWAKCGDPVDEESAKFLSPGQDSVLIKGAPFVVQWQDDAKYLCKKVKIELIEVSGNKKTKVIAKHVDNVGYFTLDKLMASVKDKTSVEKSGDRTKFEYQFRISSIKKACKGVACKILSKPFTLANAELAIYREAHGKGSQRDEAVVLVTNEVRDALVRLTALEERMVKRQSLHGELKVSLDDLDTGVMSQINNLRERLDALESRYAKHEHPEGQVAKAQQINQGKAKGNQIKATFFEGQVAKDGLPRWNRTPYSDKVSEGTADLTYNTNRRWADSDWRKLPCPEEGCPTRYKLCDFDQPDTRHLANRICQEQADALAGPGMAWDRGGDRFSKAQKRMRNWVYCIIDDVSEKPGCLADRNNLLNGTKREWSQEECYVKRRSRYEIGTTNLRSDASPVPSDCLGLGHTKFLRAECEPSRQGGIQKCSEYNWNPQTQTWYRTRIHTDGAAWIGGKTAVIKDSYEPGEQRACGVECDPPYDSMACETIPVQGGEYYEICPTGLIRNLNSCAKGGVCPVD
jgi:hypothetical protein